MSVDEDTHIDLESFWPYQVIVLADQISRYTLEIVRSEANINQSQWRVLAAIADQPGRTAADVTAVTPMDKTIVSRAVSSLIEQGLVKKTPSQGDKRRSTLETTAAGLETYSTIAKKLAATLIPSAEDASKTKDFVKNLKEFSSKMDKINQAQSLPKA